VRDTGGLMWGQDTKVHFMPLSRERMRNLCGQNRTLAS
jgi:hypothetical protein